MVARLMQAGIYPDPALVLLLFVLGRAVQEPFRPMGRKGLDSDVMTMLGIRPRAPLVMWTSAKSPLCQTGSCVTRLAGLVCDVVVDPEQPPLKTFGLSNSFLQMLTRYC